jgi:hypothetical protein
LVDVSEQPAKAIDLKACIHAKEKHRQKLIPVVISLPLVDG